MLTLEIPQHFVKFHCTKGQKRIKGKIGTFTKSKVLSNLPPLNSIPWTNKKMVTLSWFYMLMVNVFPHTIHPFSYTIIARCVPVFRDAAISVACCLSQHIFEIYQLRHKIVCIYECIFHYILFISSIKYSQINSHL